MITIPEHIVTVPPAQSARLLEKQWRARIWLKRDPYRKLLNLAWKRYFQHKVRD